LKKVYTEHFFLIIKSYAATRKQQSKLHKFDKRMMIYMPLSLKKKKGMNDRRRKKE